MNWMRYRFVYLFLSGLVILCGIADLIKWGFKFGVDFSGGTIIEYRIEKQFSTETTSKEIKNIGFDVTSIQTLEDDSYLFRLPPISHDDEEKIRQMLEKSMGGKVEMLRFESVGPSIGPDLVRKTAIALVISASTILLWIAYQFRSIKFGASAILAMFHDSLVLLGSYSLLGHFFGAEIDFLFVTAMLTILSFSVHDTIVVYDRIRETQKKQGGSITEIANKAISETMVRSLNNSFTIIFMLVALALLGGSTIRWFAVALLIGTVSGTYSSPFVAIPILVTWDEWGKRFRRDS